MTKKAVESRDRARIQARERIAKKRLMFGGSEITKGINQTIEEYPDLSMREQDFAFRYALEYRTYVQWANYYHCSFGLIQKMMSDPRVRQLIEEIKYDVRKYALGMRLSLYRAAMEQYMDIFHALNIPDTLETKRKAASEIVNWFGLGEGVKAEVEANVTIFSSQPSSGEKVVSPATKVTMETIQKEIEELEELEEMQIQVDRYKDKAKDKPDRKMGSFND